MKASKKFTSKIQILDADDDDEGFIDGDVNVDKTITAFSFGGNIAEPKPAAPLKSEVLTFNNSPKGLTSTVDNEPFSIKRGYQFKPSTIRKLSELKARHPDVNVYLNTILD